MRNINSRFSGTGGSKISISNSEFTNFRIVTSSLAKKKLKKKPKIKKTGIFEAAPYVLTFRENRGFIGCASGQRVQKFDF